MGISIIIPCHNLEGYIEKCLQSILLQNYNKEKYEILIIFDCCTDKSEAVALNCLKDSGVKYRFYHANVKRAGLARNIGLENAVGKYIYFIDGDDYLIDDQAFTKMVQAIEITQYPVIYLERFESEQKVDDREAIWRYFYTREIIGETRFSAKEINEDWEFVRRIKEKSGYREMGIKETLYHYTYPRIDSITAKFRAQFVKDFKN